MLKSNIADVIGDIREYNLVIRGQCNEAQREIAKQGAGVARMFYKIAPYDGEKDANFFITNESKSTYSIHTSNSKATHLVGRGKSITFIEFGTGAMRNPATYNTGKGKAVKNTTLDYATEHGFTMGGYGRGNGKQNGWNFTAQGRKIELSAGGEKIRVSGRGEPLYWTHGNPPGRFMYRALKDMRLDAPEIARESFKKFKNENWKGLLVK